MKLNTAICTQLIFRHIQFILQHILAHRSESKHAVFSRILGGKLRKQCGGGLAAALITVAAMLSPLSGTSCCVAWGRGSRSIEYSSNLFLFGH